MPKIEGNTIFRYERQWFPQPHQVEQDAIDAINVSHSPLAERQARAFERYAKLRKSLIESFKTKGVIIDKSSMVVDANNQRKE